MDKIEIFTKPKKAIWPFIISIALVIMVIFSAYMATNYKDSLYAIGGLLFFGIISIVLLQLLIKKQLYLIINSQGINVNPKKELLIDWKSIETFSTMENSGGKFITIILNNPNYWIEKEKNFIKQTIMFFSNKYYGTPYTLNARMLEIEHDQLVNILKENLNRHKYAT